MCLVERRKPVMEKSVPAERPEGQKGADNDTLKLKATCVQPAVLTVSPPHKANESHFLDCHAKHCFIALKKQKVPLSTCFQWD